VSKVDKIIAKITNERKSNLIFLNVENILVLTARLFVTFQTGFLFNITIFHQERM
jgi:hypothetical protein